MDNISSISRVLSILECFATTHAELSIAALSEQLKLPSSTVHRQIRTLVDLGYLSQNPRTKSYRIGNHFVWLCSRILNKYDLRTIARPLLRSLCDEVRETVHLVQIDGFDIFYLDKIESDRSISCVSQIGLRLPAHATSTGKLLLSAADDCVIDQLCARLPMIEPLTCNTITTPEALRAALRDAKERGYALDNEEVEIGLVCIAAPVYDMNSEMVAAINIAGPSFRMYENLDIFKKKLMHCSRDISALLGCPTRTPPGHSKLPLHAGQIP